MSDLWQARPACRACGGDLDDIVRFGDIHINSFPAAWEPLPPAAPITLCLCGACRLAQLRHTVHRPALFAHYWYRAAVQPQMLRDLQDAVAWAVGQGPPNARRVLSIGVNDGSEMDYLPDGVRDKVGIDPAANLREDALRHCDTVVTDFFPSSKLPPGPYDIILSIACLYSMDNLRAVCDAVEGLLAEDGVWVVQVSDATRTFADGNFGDLTHEHVTFFSKETFARTVSASGLRVTAVQENAVNGGSLRFAVKKGQGSIPWRDAPPAVILHQFANQVQDIGRMLRVMLGDAALCHEVVGGYGASTKANTCLSFWGIGPHLVPWIADRNPEKWGRTTANGIPIISEDAARERTPDVLLLLIPQFLAAVQEREHAFLARGGRFLVPYPKVHEVEGVAAVAV